MAIITNIIDEPPEDMMVSHYLPLFDQGAATI